MEQCVEIKSEVAAAVNAIFIARDKRPLDPVEFAALADLVAFLERR